MIDVEVAPLSFAQERLWTVDRSSPAPGAYNVRRAIRLRGPLDVPALERSLSAIVERHEVLRTAFPVVDGGPIAAIQPAAPLAVPVLDFTRVDDAALENAARAAVLAEGAREFSLENGPVFRAALVRLRPEHHILVLTFHHIAIDEWSFDVFDRELSAFYAAHCGGAAPALSDLPVTYADYAIWQRDSLQAGVFAGHAAYWCTALDAAPQRVMLPYAATKQAARSRAGDAVSVALDAETVRGVRALARSHDASTFMTFFAVFGALLYRYCGQDDFIVGAPIANRLRIELEPLIGFFVNTLPLRVRAGGALPFDEHLRRIRTTTLAAYDHAEFPFERIVSELRAERAAGETPLTNVLFHVQPREPGELLLKDLATAAVAFDETPPKFDLIFRVDEHATGFECSIVFAAEAFERVAMRRMLAHFENLLRAIVARPATPIGALPMLSEAELRTQAVAWNDTTRPFPGDDSLAALFAAQAERSPHAIAVGSDAGDLTYEWLDVLSTTLAHALRDRGVARGSVVGICTERSLATIVATLAIAKAGAAYLPIDPGFPAKRIAFMLADARAEIVLTQRQTAAIISAANGRIALLDIDSGARATRRRSGDALPAGSGNDLAYVMYTSGSTGTPKGVCIPARAVTRLVLNTTYVAIDPSQTVAQVSNVCFDAFTFELWGALLHGARLQIAPQAIVLSPERFARWIEAHSIRIMFLTTALFRLIGRERPAAFAALDCLLTGGEVADAASFAAVLEAGAPGRLLNVYGPTEATTFALACEIDRATDIRRSIPIGTPISNTRALILDRDANLVPVGVVGELFLGGPGLALGYLNDAGSTAKKFVRDPYAADSEARLYATGDRARYRADGLIEFAGRSDRQQKIRGFRVEVDEIEATLRALPDVRDAFVDVRDGDAGDATLAAYVVDDARPRRSSAALRRLLASELPAYAVPAAIVAVEAIPLNRNGKVDRAALLEVAAERTNEAAFETNNPLHLKLALLWERQLGCEGTAVDENFFEAGGDSLGAARLLLAIERELEVELSLAVFLEEPTIAHLARTIVKHPHGAPVPVVTALRPVGTLAPFFFMHLDMHGGGYYTRALARRFDAERPFYVLPPHGTAGPQTIEAMADDYFAAIKAVRPSGPYVLGGFCSGGMVALEIARRMQAAGDDVVHLVMLDPSSRNAHLGRLADGLDHAAEAAGLEAGIGSRLCGAVGLAALWARDLWVRIGRLARLGVRGGFRGIWQRISRGPAPSNYVRPDDETVLPFWNRVTARYIPRPYGGAATIIVARGHGSAVASATARKWHALVPRARFHSVPGEHLTCITRFVDETAIELAAALDRAQVTTG